MWELKNETYYRSGIIKSFHQLCSQAAGLQPYQSFKISLKISVLILDISLNLKLIKLCGCSFQIHYSIPSTEGDQFYIILGIKYMDNLIACLKQNWAL